MTWHFRTLTPCTLCLVSLLFILPQVQARQAEYINQEQAPATTVEDIDSPLEHAFEKPPVKQVVPWLHDKLKDKSPFLRDTRLTAKPRTYYFNRLKDGQPDNKTWALGGALEYQSGQWKDRLQAGLTLYTSQKLYGPRDNDGTLLLKPGQHGFEIMGEAYVDIRATEEDHLRLFRQLINVPYVNRQDSRMVPNTFEAYTLYNKDDPKLRYIVSHVEKMKKRNSDSFVSMTEAAGIPDKDRGLSMLGGRYLITDNADIGIITQQSWEFMNTTYAEANTRWKLSEDWNARLSAQYTRQRSIGDELGGDFDTYVWGTALSLGYKGNLFTLATSKTDDNVGIRNPFGGYPGYLSLMQKDFNRADETGLLLGISSELRALNIKGLSANLNLAWGNTPESGQASSPDQTELDFTLDYRVPSGGLEGLWLRARASQLDQDDHPDEVDSTDIRIIVNYEIPIL